jgi:hypothetical protein
VASVEFFVELFFALVGLSIIGYFLFTFTGNFPSNLPFLANAKNVGQGMVSVAYQIIDSFVFGMIVIVCLIEIYVSHRNPSREKALFAFFELLALGSISYIVNNVITTLTVLNTTLYLPNLTAFFTTGMGIFLIAVFLVINILLNLYEAPRAQQANANLGTNYEYEQNES